MEFGEDARQFLDHDEVVLPLVHGVVTRRGLVVPLVVSRRLEPHVEEEGDETRHHPGRYLSRGGEATKTGHGEGLEVRGVS